MKMPLNPAGMNMDTKEPDQAQNHLACPYCGKLVAVAETQLVDGCALTCPHCEEECVLEREWGHGDRWRWLLVEDGDADEP